MDYDAHLARYNGKSLLYAAERKREYLRGQCVQQICFYNSDNGKPVAWADAKDWWLHPALVQVFDFVPKTTYNHPPRGAVIIWNGQLPGTAGAGHIGIFDRAVSPTIFVSFDSNWGGKTCRFVTHSYDYVLGWMIPKAQVKQGDDEVITEQDRDILRIEHANAGWDYDRTHKGEFDQVFLAAWQGKSSKQLIRAQFAHSADFRHAQLQIRQKYADIQTIANQQNATITELTQKLKDATISGTEKQAMLNESLAKLSQCTIELETTHDQILDIEKTAVQNATGAIATVQKTSLLTKIIMAFITRKQ